MPLSSDTAKGSDLRATYVEHVDCFIPLDLHAKNEMPTCIVFFNDSTCKVSVFHYFHLVLDS